MLNAMSTLARLTAEVFLFLSFLFVFFFYFFFNSVVFHFSFFFCFLLCFASVLVVFVSFCLSYPPDHVLFIVLVLTGKMSYIRPRKSHG